MSARDDAAIRTALCCCFPADRQVFQQTRAWHGSLPSWSVLVEREGTVIAHAGIVEREVRFGVQPLRVGGVQNVLVLPDYRGGGLFRQVMSSAMEEARRRDLELGLLFCTPELSVKYARVGWHCLDARRVIRIDERGCPRPLPARNITMYYPLRRSDVPPGDIHLQGNDW